jgi:zinc-ribbon domain
MALVKCKECGEQVSTGAKSCPKCGAKPPKKTSIVTWTIVIFTIFVGYALIQSPSAKTPSASASVPASAPSGALRSEESSAPVSKPQWRTSTSVDKMTGKRQVFATSPTVPPNETMEFPYRDVTAWMGVGCDGKSEWVFIGFSKAPNLTDTEAQSGGYSTFSTRIKWDESLQNVALTQEWGAEFLHFQDGRQGISKITASNSALLELKWYGQNHPYFNFPLDGAAASVTEMRKQCSAK